MALSLFPSPQVVFGADVAWFGRTVAAARRRVRFVAPGLTKVQAGALADASARSVDVRVVLDPSELRERQGYGELAAIPFLEGAGVAVQQLPGLALSFLLVDGTGHILFPESRMFAEAGVGVNALTLDPVMLCRLNQTFFPPASPEEEREANVQAARAQASRHLPPAPENASSLADLAPLDQASLQSALRALDRNPPRDPDLTRQFSAYTNRLQFLEITLQGGTFEDRIVSLPKDIPFDVDKALRRRLHMQMKVFHRRDLVGLQAFSAYRRQVEQVRDCYSVFLPSRNRRIFHTEHKHDLLREVEQLRGQLPEVSSVMEDDLARAVADAAVLLENEAYRLLLTSPNVSRCPSGRSVDTWARAEACRIVSLVSFPHPRAVLERLDLRVHFYDMTWEDFDNHAFISELHSLKVIDQRSADELRTLTAAFAVKA